MKNTVINTLINSVLSLNQRKQDKVRTSLNKLRDGSWERTTFSLTSNLPFNKEVHPHSFYHPAPLMSNWPSGYSLKLSSPCFKLVQFGKQFWAEDKTLQRKVYSFTGLLLWKVKNPWCTIYLHYRCIWSSNRWPKLVSHPVKAARWGSVSKFIFASRSGVHSSNSTNQKTSFP